MFHHIFKLFITLFKAMLRDDIICLHVFVCVRACLRVCVCMCLYACAHARGQDYFT